MGALPVRSAAARQRHGTQSGGPAHRIGNDLVTADIVSAQGLQHVPMLESVCLSSQPEDGLRAIFNFAAGRYGTGTTIVASNLSYLDGAVIKAAGARALPSSFNAYMFFKARAAGLEHASSLNLEVI